jgi:hypothetical protein
MATISNPVTITAAATTAFMVAPSMLSIRLQLRVCFLTKIAGTLTSHFCPHLKTDSVARCDALANCQ